MIPFEYYLFVDSKSEELSINCENIDSFTKDEKTGRLVIVYFVAQTDFLGRRLETMERRVDTYDCGEADLLLKTFAGVRNKVIAGQNQISQKKSIKPRDEPKVLAPAQGKD